MISTAAAEPQLDLAARVRTVIDERILRMQTTRVVEISGVKYTLRDFGAHLNVVAVKSTGHRVEVNFALFNYHNDVLIVGGVKGATELKLPKLKMHMHEESSGVEIEHGFWVTVRKLVASAYLEDPPSSVIAEAAEAEESVVLFKTSDILALATAVPEGYAYELAGISPAGNDISKQLGRAGTFQRIDGGLVCGSTRLPALDGDAAFAVLRDHLQRRVEAAAEPVQQLPTGEFLFREYCDALNVYAVHHTDDVVAEHGAVKAHIDSIFNEHDNGLFALYTSIRGERLVAHDEANDVDWPVPYVRFHMAPGDMISIQFLISDLVVPRDLEKKVSVKRVPSEKFVAVILAACKHFLPGLLAHLAHVNPAAVATAAAAAPLKAVARSLGADGGKLVGKSVLGFKVESVVLLAADDELVGFSCSGNGSEAFVRITPDKAVTAYVYRGVRRHKHSSELVNTRLGSIVAALQLEEAPKEVNAAAEPQTGSNALNTLHKLQGLKISSKHFHIKIRPQAKPSVDDHGNAFIMGDIVSDANARAVYGDPDFRYGFSIMVPGSVDRTVSDKYPIRIKLPHIYPSIARPEEVPIRRDVGANNDDVQTVARNIAKLLKPWFETLDAEVENYADMVALLHTDFKASPTVEFYRITRTQADMRLPGEPRKVRIDPHGNRVVRLKFELTVPAMQAVLDDKATTKLGSDHVFDLSAAPGPKPNTLIVSAVAGSANYADNFDGKPSDQWSPAIVNTERALPIVQSWINDYLFKLDNAYVRVSNS